VHLGTDQANNFPFIALNDNNGSSLPYLKFGDTDASSDYDGKIEYSLSNQQMNFYVNEGTDHSLLIGSDVIEVKASTNPLIRFHDSGGATDKKLVDIRSDDGDFFISFRTDASSSHNVMSLNRQATGNKLTSAAFHSDQFVVTNADNNSNLFVVNQGSNRTKCTLLKGSDMELMMESIYNAGVEENVVIKAQNTAGVAQTLKLNPDSGGKVKIGGNAVTVEDEQLLVNTTTAVSITGLHFQVTGLSRFDDTIHAGPEVYTPLSFASGMQVADDAGTPLIALLRGSVTHAKMMGYISGTSTFAIVDWNMTGNGVTLAANGQSWGSQSDGTTKIIHSHIENVLDTIDAIRCVRFNFKTDGDINPAGNINYTKERIGFIAQDILPLYPEAVEVEPDQPLRLQYQDMIPVSIQAIKELTAELRRLKDRVTALEAQLG